MRGSNGEGRELADGREIVPRRRSPKRNGRGGRTRPRLPKEMPLVCAAHQTPEIKRGHLTLLEGDDRPLRRIGEIAQLLTDPSQAIAGCPHQERNVFHKPLVVDEVFPVQGHEEVDILSPG